LPTELTYTLVSGGTAQTSGVLVFNADGTFTYTPHPNFSGVAFFTYQVCDNAAACSQALVNITVTSLPPIAIADNFDVDEDNTLLADVSNNDSDPDSPKSELSFRLMDGGTANIQGKVALANDGKLTYIPNANFNGNVSFTYQVCDAQNNFSAITSVTILVRPINDAPLAQDDQAETNENQSVEGSLATNDTDIENDALSYLSGTFTTENQGQITIQTNGNFIYTPRRGFVGTDCFEYTVCDIQNACSKAKVCINVKPSSTVFVPEGFSPNGDGLYDSFVIEGIAGKKVTVKIYNRWGNLVYESADYKNDWKGTANMGLHTGENLPDGTYFYTIDLGDGSKPLSNYVIIKR
jgi:gliding motility-associated-like protein